MNMKISFIEKTIMKIYIVKVLRAKTHKLQKSMETYAKDMVTPQKILKMNVKKMEENGVMVNANLKMTKMKQIFKMNYVKIKKA